MPILIKTENTIFKPKELKQTCQAYFQSDATCDTVQGNILCVLCGYCFLTAKGAKFQQRAQRLYIPKLIEFQFGLICAFICVNLWNKKGFKPLIAENKVLAPKELKQTCQAYFQSDATSDIVQGNALCVLCDNLCVLCG